MSSGSSSKSTRRRVKVYQLSDKGDWEDKGTGHVEFVPTHEKLEGPALVVVSEKDEEEALLETKVHSSILYTIQQDTLIVWTDPETEEELALSFQEAAGCTEIMNQITTVQKQEDTLNSTSNEETGYELPEPTMSNIPKLVEIFTEPINVYKRERLSNALLKEGYLTKLFEVLRMCEDLEDTDNLHNFFIIFKNIVLMNDPSLIETLLSEEYVFDVMGALQYDPELSKPMKHRDYLKSQVVFKEVIPFNNPALVAKIHQSFRVGYLKDTVLPRLLDDGTFTTLSSLVHFNNLEIVSLIQNDARFMSELFTKIKTHTKDTELKDLIGFVQELCNLAKSLQIPSRIAFYQVLNKNGFCDIFEIGLSCPLLPVRLSTVNIIDCVLGYDANFLRTFILSQRPKFEVFNLIISVLLHDPEMGLRVQLSEIVRILIDTTSIELTYEKDSFLSIFYSNFINKLVEPVTNPSKEEVSSEMSLVKECICDILAFCVTHHEIRMKTFLLSGDVPTKVLQLANIKDKPVTLAVVRFFRAVIGMKDEQYNKFIITHNLFEPILKVFWENGPKYNLLNSAILELFDFIKKENIKSLVSHVVEKYKEQLKTVTYVDTFKMLIVKHEQNQETAEQPPTPPLQSGIKSMDKEEEEYFLSTNEDDSTTMLPLPSDGPPLKPLVDYTDEEEDTFFSKRKKEEDSSSPTSNHKTVNKPRMTININFNAASSPLNNNREREENAEEEDNDAKRRKVE